MTVVNNLLWHKKSDIFLSETETKNLPNVHLLVYYIVSIIVRDLSSYTARRFSLLIHSCPISFHYSNVKDPTASYKRLLEFDRLNIMNFSTWYDLEVSIIRSCQNPVAFLKRLLYNDWL